MLKSLKRRIIVLSLLSLGAVWLVTIAQSYRDARREIDRIFDVHLAQAASLVMMQTIGVTDDVTGLYVSPLRKYTRNVSFQVWQTNSGLMLHSATAPTQRMGGDKEGFSTAEIEGVRWRIFSAWSVDRHFQIYVGERIAVRERLIAEMRDNLMRPLFLALPMLALVLWLAVATGLKPLDRVARELALRKAERLDPVAVAGVPSEVQPMVARLNELFERVAFSIDNIRRFTADAAHELRTPLTAIRAQAQVALASAGEEGRTHALRSVIAGCDQATRLIEQLLTLARLDSTELPAPMDVVNLRLLAAEVVADIAPAALGNGTELALVGDEGVVVTGNPGLLRVLLRNLVDNAVRYSPHGSRVDISLVHDNGAVILSVRDNGEGIPPDVRERIFDRFFRGTSNGEEGSGLGLSIVKRIADIHRAVVSLSDNGDGQGGLRVDVKFAAA